MRLIANHLQDRPLLHIILIRIERASVVIICSCNVLRDTDLRTLARNGVCCEREAYARLGCKPQCGRCLSYARALIRDEAQACEVVACDPVETELTAA